MTATAWHCHICKVKAVQILASVCRINIILFGLPVYQRQLRSFREQFLCITRTARCQIQNLVIIPQQILTIVQHRLPVCLFLIAVFYQCRQWFIEVCGCIMITACICHRIIRCTVIRSCKESCLKADIEHLFHKYRNVQMKNMLVCSVCRICVGHIQQCKLTALVIICVRGDGKLLS